MILTLNYKLQKHAWNYDETYMNMKTEQIIETKPKK